jgi:hypothetical protein
MLEKERIHFHEKTSVGGDESLSCPIDLKLILFPLFYSSGNFHRIQTRFFQDFILNRMEDGAVICLPLCFCTVAMY